MLEVPIPPNPPNENDPAGEIEADWGSGAAPNPKSPPLELLP